MKPFAIPTKQEELDRDTRVRIQNVTRHRLKNT